MSTWPDPGIINVFLEQSMYLKSVNVSYITRLQYQFCTCCIHERVFEKLLQIIRKIVQKILKYKLALYFK